jgi:hypothetical protein
MYDIDGLTIVGIQRTHGGRNQETMGYITDNLMFGCLEMGSPK